MKKIKTIAIGIASAVALTGAGYMIYDKTTTVDFGKIEIDGIPDKSDDAVRIMSFNLRYCDDKEGSVKNRSKIVAAIIESYAPDSFGVQEATGEWLDILTEALGKKYAYVGHARDEKGYKSEYNAVFFLKEKYTLTDEGTIWLSETPDVKFSKSFDSVCHRVASWAVLENKENGKKYTHLNTHLDHVLEDTRTAQVKVLIGKLQQLSESVPVFCTGDFNAEPTSPAYAEMLRITQDTRLTAESSDEGITFHGYGKAEEGSAGPIDYIFASEEIRTETFRIIRNTAKDMYPSDHYPIMADSII